MNSKRFLVPFVGVLSATGFLAGIAAEKLNYPGVTHFDHEKVASLFQHGGTLLATNSFKILCLRREGPGEVEEHQFDTDIFYVLEGSANFVTGGQMVDPRTTGPGEKRARTIEAGEERSLAKGDVLVIPNGVPHWFKEVRAPFLYYVVKVSK